MEANCFLQVKKRVIIFLVAYGLQWFKQLDTFVFKRYFHLSWLLPD